MLSIDDIIKIAQSKEESKQYSILPYTIFSTKQLATSVGVNTETFFDYSQGTLSTTFNDTNLVEPQKIFDEKFIVVSAFYRLYNYSGSTFVHNGCVQDLTNELFINDKKKSSFNITQPVGTNGSNTLINNYTDIEKIQVPIVISRKDRFYINSTYLLSCTTTGAEYIKLYLKGYIVKKNFNKEIEI